VRENVAEHRLEVVCPKAHLGAALAALRRSHPYEEPAYDVYPLVTAAGGPGGEGRCGELVPARSVGEISDRLKTLLGVSHIDIVGEAGRIVDRAAIVCGSGGDFTTDAAERGAQLLITGEIRFHDALLAQAHHLAVVVLGHYASERFAMEKLADRLTAQFLDVSVWASKTEQDPITRSGD
jgi:putative NIF3 family GTP cyclohydrolase 1 type 2